MYNMLLKYKKNFNRLTFINREKNMYIYLRY